MELEFHFHVCIRRVRKGNTTFTLLMLRNLVWSLCENLKIKIQKYTFASSIFLHGDKIWYMVLRGGKKIESVCVKKVPRKGETHSEEFHNFYSLLFRCSIQNGEVLRTCCRNCEHEKPTKWLSQKMYSTNPKGSWVDNIDRSQKKVECKSENLV